MEVGRRHLVRCAVYHLLMTMIWRGNCENGYGSCGRLGDGNTDDSIIWRQPASCGRGGGFVEMSRRVQKRVMTDGSRRCRRRCDRSGGLISTIDAERDAQRGRGVAKGLITPEIPHSSAAGWQAASQVEFALLRVRALVDDDETVFGRRTRLVTLLEVQTMNHVEATPFRHQLGPAESHRLACARIGLILAGRRRDLASDTPRSDRRERSVLVSNPSLHVFDLCAGRRLLGSRAASERLLLPAASDRARRPSCAQNLLTRRACQPSFNPSDPSRPIYRNAQANGLSQIFGRLPNSVGTPDSACRTSTWLEARQQQLNHTIAPPISTQTAGYRCELLSPIWGR